MPIAHRPSPIAHCSSDFRPLTSDLRLQVPSISPSSVRPAPPYFPYSRLLTKAVLISIYTHMKTTIDIADSLFSRAKGLSRRDGTTLKQLVDEGLEKVLAEKEAQQPIKIEPVIMEGTGIDPALLQGGWSAMRDAIYGQQSPPS